MNRRCCAAVLLVVALSGCQGSASDSGPIPAPSSTTNSGSASMPDQKTQLEATAAELRAAVDALAALVPTPTASRPPADKAYICDPVDDDGSKQWVYDPLYRYPGTGADVIGAAAAELERRGFRIGQQLNSTTETSFTAVKDGAAITVADGPLPDEPGSAIVISGYGPCVAADGTIDTRNPQ